MKNQGKLPGLSFFARGVMEVSLLKKMRALGLLMLLTVFMPYTVNSQCINTTAYGSEIAPAPPFSGTISCHFAGEYGEWTSLVSGGNYVLTSTVSTDYLTVTEGSPTGPVVADGTQPLAFMASVSGTYYVHVSTDALCGTESSCRDITMTALYGCNNTVANGTATAPVAPATSMITCQNAGEYGTWNSLVAGTYYEVTSTVATDFITIRQGTPGGVVVASGTQPVTFNAAVSGTYYIHVNTDNSCGTQTACRDITMSVTVPACTNTVDYGVEDAPQLPGTSAMIGCTYAQEYNTWNNFIAGVQYEVSSSVATDYLSIRQGTSNGPVAIAGTQPLTFTPSVSGTYYVHVNTNSSCGVESQCRDITVSIPQPALDMGATALAAPLASGCLTANETVTITIENLGTQQIDFSVNPVTVNASVTGPNPVTFTPVVINTGVLAAGGTQNVNVSTAYNMSAPGTYIFSAGTSVTGDGFVPNDTMTSATIVVGGGTASVNTASICAGNSATLTLTGYSGTIQWQSSTDGGTTWVNETGTGSTSDTYSVTPSATIMYQALVCGTMTSNAVTVNVDNPPAPTVTGDTRCGTGIVNLSASGTGTLYWYDAATGGNMLTTGTTYSPTVSATTTYYVSNSTGAAPTTHTTTFAAGNGSNGNMFGITALSTVTITGFDGHTTGGTSTWEIYYRPDDYTTVTGANTSSAGWILLGTAANVPSAGTGLPTPIPVTFSVTIPAGSTYSFHVVTTAGTGVQYTNGTTVGAVYNSTPDLQFREGHGGTLFSCTNSPRVFNGRIHYTTGCQSARVPVTATVNPAPAITASSSTPAICAGGSATLSVSSPNAGYTYTWSPAASLSSSTGTSVTATPSTNTTYTVDAFDAVSGCVNSTTVSLAVNPLPAGVTATATTPAVCMGSTVDLSSTVTPNVSLYSEPFEAFPLTQFATGGSGVTAAQSTTYYSQGTSSVRLTYANSANGSLAMTSDINLSSYNAPQLQFSHICATEGSYDYGYVQYSTDGGTTWTSFPPSSYLGTGTLKNSVVSFDKTSYSNWSSQLTSSSATPGTGPATALWQTETIDLSAYQSSTQFRVRFRITSDGSVIYYGWLIDDMKITYQPAYTFNWTASPAGFTSSVQNPTGVAPSASTAYTVTVTDPATTCSSTASVSVTVNPLPTVVATAAASTICEGDSVALAASGADTYSWSPATGLGSTTGASVNAAPATTTTYTVSGTDLNGCMNTASVTINVNPKPVVTLAAISDLCEDAAAISITGESPAGGTFSGPGISGSTFDPAVAGVGTHTITYSYTDGNSCSNTATATVTVNALPVVTLAAFTDECSNGSAITLTGESPSGGTFSGTGVSGGMFDPAVAGVGTHTITYNYTDANGCSSSATSSITVNAPSVVTLAAISPVCETGSAITLGGESPTGGTFSGAGVSSGVFDPAVAGAGVHDVIYTYTDANMCSNSDTTSVTVYAAPVVTLASQGPVCSNTAAFTITGESPVGGTFSGTGVSGNMFDPSMAGAGMHDIIYTYTDTNMCSSSDTATVTVNAAPAITLASYSAVCEGASAISLTGESPVGGAYSGTGVSGSTFDPVAAGPGTHYVVYSYTDTNSCTGVDSAAIVVNANPVVNLGADITQCGGSVTLNAGNPGSMYAWSTNDSIQMITVSSSGTYDVTVTDTNACSASDTVMVTINAAAVVDLGPDTTICSGNAVVLDAGAGFSSYMWSTNATTQTISVSASGPYIVTVANADGCQDSDTLVVTVDPCIGIAENGGGYLVSVRPNPSEGKFNLVISGGEISRLSVDILDIQGKLVYGFVENNISGEFVKEINLDGFAKGIYYLRMNTGTSVVTEKLVIQ